jgi:cell wall-associated NlpC family hydrolase
MTTAPARRAARAAALAAALCLGLGASAPVRAEPAAPSGDAVLHLLQERGLLPSPAQLASRVDASPMVQHVRDVATEMVLSAMNFLGVPYRRGGNNAEQGFDCSGFTRYVFENSLGLVLPRRADQQAQTAGLLPIPRDELKPGDLVFFNTMRRAFSHVGIYVGEGRFIHAPRTGGEVRIEDMRQAYWSKRFNGARRAEVAAPTASGPR